ncbi:MAG TPA: hypothetical protein VHF26_26060 [Trebonia sp.]|nr:hypothetical protein [Trebonia sp.]
MRRKEMLDRVATAGSAPLCCLSEEEMAAVGADERVPFRRAEPPAGLGGLTAGARDAVLAAALRGLVERGLLEPPAGPEGLQPAGAAVSDELGVVLGIRRAPVAVTFVVQRSFLAVLYGFREMRLTDLAPGMSGFLEERIDQSSGSRQFTVRTVRDAVETLAALVDPDGEVASEPLPDGEADAAVPAETVRALLDLGPGVTRLEAYHSRPEGTRRMQVSLLVRRREGVTLWSAAGAGPEQASLFAVTADGLRHVIWETLCDPAGDQPPPGREPGGHRRNSRHSGAR